MKKRPQPEPTPEQRAQLAEHGKIIDKFFARVVAEGAWPAGPPGEKVVVDADTAELLATTLAEAERIRDERGDMGHYRGEQLISDFVLALQKAGLQYINKRIRSTDQEG